jgi:1-deoxy-D-xylulose 5-phosphate reductoisomerase
MRAANERAVHMFLEHRLGFNRIYDCAAAAVEKLGIIKDPDLDTIIDADSAARRFVEEEFGK